MNVPKLRFKEFSGEWEVKRLGDIALAVTSGSRDWAQYYSSSGSKFIRMTNLSREGIDLRLDDLKYVDITSDSTDGKRTNLMQGDILISITAELGKIGWIPPNFGEAFINQHTALVRIKSKESDSKFIAYLLATQKMNQAINSLNDAGAKAGLNLPTIKGFILTLPNIPEQTKIASFLTAIDEKIAQLAQKHALLNQYKKGMMQQIFSQQLRFKDDNGQEFGEWVNCTLESCASFYRGGALSKADLDEKGIYECIHYGELFTSYSEVIHHVKSRTNINGLIKSEYGDILMPSSDVTPSGLARASSLLKEDIIIGGDINIIRPNEVIFSPFLSYLLNFEKNKIIQLVSGTTVKHIYIKDIKTIELSIPSSFSEQTKIANFLSSIDQKIDQMAVQLDATKQYKRSLLQQMFV